MRPQKQILDCPLYQKGSNTLSIKLSNMFWPALLVKITGKNQGLSKTAADQECQISNAWKGNLVLGIKVFGDRYCNMRQSTKNMLSCANDNRPAEKVWCVGTQHEIGFAEQSKKILSDTLTKREKDTYNLQKNKPKQKRRTICLHHPWWVQRGWSSWDPDGSKEQEVRSHLGLVHALAGWPNGAKSFFRTK